MLFLRARAKSGRIVVDDPTDLPEGAKVEFLPADDVDELAPDERARFFGFIARSIRTHVSGTGMPADALLAELRQR
jgi:hypothetical protein